MSQVAIRGEYEEGSIAVHPQDDRNRTDIVADGLMAKGRASSPNDTEGGLHPTEDRTGRR